MFCARLGRVVKKYFVLAGGGGRNVTFNLLALSSHVLALSQFGMHGKDIASPTRIGHS